MELRTGTTIPISNLLLLSFAKRCHVSCGKYLPVISKSQHVTTVLPLVHDMSFL